MNYETLQYHINDDGIATVTVNRPKKLNALNEKLLDELAQLVEELKENATVRGVMITGAGEKAFVAGADIKELQSLDQPSGQAVSQRGQQIFSSIEQLRKPVVAVVNGYALGGGAELAMACHLRIASPKAVFGLPETGLGLIPGYGGTQRLPRIVGRARALEMILTAKQIKADEARAMGLINEISENPLAEAKQWLQKILANGPLAVASALKAVYQSNDKPDFELEAELFGQLCASDDAAEGTSAFLEKRKPQFRGA